MDIGVMVSNSTFLNGTVSEVKKESIINGVSTFGINVILENNYCTVDNVVDSTILNTCFNLNNMDHSDGLIAKFKELKNMMEHTYIQYLDVHLTHVVNMYLATIYNVNIDIDSCILDYEELLSYFKNKPIYDIKVKQLSNKLIKFFYINHMHREKLIKIIDTKKDSITTIPYLTFTPTLYLRLFNNGKFTKDVLTIISLLDNIKDRRKLITARDELYKYIVYINNITNAIEEYGYIELVYDDANKLTSNARVIIHTSNNDNYIILFH